MPLENRNASEATKSPEAQKPSVPYVSMKEQMAGMGDLKLAEREDEKLAEKTLLADLMKDMNKDQKLQYVQDRIQVLQNSVKHAGSGKAARAAEQIDEREALLGYVDARLHVISESLKRVTGPARAERSAEYNGERERLQEFKTSLER